MPMGVACVQCGRIQHATTCRPCKLKAANRRRKGGESFYHGTAWKRLREAVVRRDGACLNPTCESTTELVAHHIVARKDGGPDDPSNLMTLCHSCHSAYEAHLRAGLDTQLRRAIDEIAAFMTRRA